MKRIERRHLKQNELADFVAQATEFFEANQRQVTTGAVAVIVVLAAVFGYLLWKNGVESRAHTMLASAMTVEDTPVGPADPTAAQKGPRFANAQEKAQAALEKYKAVADQYPSTDAGIFARYQQAASLVALNRTKDAAAVFQQVIDRDAKGIYGQMARFGLAEAQARDGQYDQAIAGFKSLADEKDSNLPLDGVLMQLGHVYADAGKKADAQQTFNRVVNEFPQSQFGQEARQQLDDLKRAS